MQARLGGDQMRDVIYVEIHVMSEKVRCHMSTTKPKCCCTQNDINNDKNSPGSATQPNNIEIAGAHVKGHDLRIVYSLYGKGTLRIGAF